MAQVLRSREARCGIEILRTEDAVVMAVLDSDCTIDLKSHPTVWAEVGAQYRDGKRVFQFDDEWRPLFRHGPHGIEAYPVVEATRKFIRGCYSAPSGFKGGALDALIDVLPHGEVHLFIREIGFIGRFASLEDAQMIAGALKVDRPIIFGSPEEIMELPDPDLIELITWINPEYRLPSKLKLTHAEGIFEMAKKTVKKKVAKVAKAEAKQRRADGPVAKAREIFEKMRDASSADIIAACEAAGVNRGTATTQLGRWRKANNIQVKRGGARKKGDAKSAAKTDQPSPGKKSSKKGASAEPKGGLPKSKAKGEKRHKPATSGKSSDTPQDAAPASNDPAPQPSSPTRSKKGKSVSVSSAEVRGEPTASTSTDADSPSAANGEQKQS